MTEQRTPASWPTWWPGIDDSPSAQVEVASAPDRPADVAHTVRWSNVGRDLEQRLIAAALIVTRVLPVLLVVAAFVVPGVLVVLYWAALVRAALIGIGVAAGLLALVAYLGPGGRRGSCRCR